MNVLAALFLHLLLALGGETKSADNEFVKVDVSLAKADLQPGGKGTILVSFATVDGIHITVDPPLSLKLEKNLVTSVHGKPDITIEKESGYLSTSTPVEQRFSVSRKATPGEHIIKGTIVYYFCSDTEGWCRKFSQPVTLRLNIQRP